MLQLLLLLLVVVRLVVLVVLILLAKSVQVLRGDAGLLSVRHLT